MITGAARAIALRVIGALLICAAVALWLITLCSTDAPFRLIVIPGPDALCQVVHWMAVAIIGGLGAACWSSAKT